MTDDTQNTWSEYYERKREQRIAEASELWRLMQKAGVTEETVLALDFVLFGTSQSDVASLAEQLSENYEMQVLPGNEDGYWLSKGTTRPHGITLNQEQHLDWVEFMADVAHSYGCVLSTWSLEAPSLAVHFNSDAIESAS